MMWGELCVGGYRGNTENLCMVLLTFCEPKNALKILFFKFMTRVGEIIKPRIFPEGQLL